jgi:hypothetical protein
LYNWFLSKSKFRYTEKPVNAASLKMLAGTYAGPDTDTVQIVWTEAGLVAKPPHEEIPLKHAGDLIFFIDPAQLLELRFVVQKNKVMGFLFMGNDRTFFRRLN